MSEVAYRSKPPKDGPGPRGVPDCYYTSRVLDSTFRYARFVKKLRATEEEERLGLEMKLKDLRDTQINDFFLRCDRRSLIKNVERRVDLCMSAYEKDLEEKRKRLKDLFTKEEEANIRKFVVNAQAGAAAVWQDKMDRLQYLLAKRKQEHLDKYKDTPLSKCAFVLPCIYKLRTKEAQEIQLYQMKEKQARKMAEKEMDKMWHEVVMKESDALAARMERDAIERIRRDGECKQYTDMQLEQRRIQREKEKEMVKEEAKRFKAVCEADNQKEAEAQLERQKKREETAANLKKEKEEASARLAKRAADEDTICKTWESLAEAGSAADKFKEELRQRKEREQVICNKALSDLRKEYVTLGGNLDSYVQEEMHKVRDVIDLKRCQFFKKIEKNDKDVRQAIKEQMKDNEKTRELLREKKEAEDECKRQLDRQLQALVEHKKVTDAQARKSYQKNLLDQAAYHNHLKEIDRLENIEQNKKYNAATEEFQEQIKQMLCRPFFSDEVHPFTKKLASGLKMKEKCPCSKPDYCK